MKGKMAVNNTGNQEFVKLIALNQNKFCKCNL